MDPVIIKNCKIGEGKPKIIVPIVGVTKEDILKEAELLKTLTLDVIEWRIDWYEYAFDSSKIKETAEELCGILKNIPILCTFRTAKEGGEKEIAVKTYTKLLKEISICESIDMIDVEIFTGDEAALDIIQTCHANNTVVIASNHDFKKTPDKNDIIDRLKKMQNMGADILKIAVMPNSKRDVLTLLEATEEMNRKHAKKPIVTMSMGGEGVISRLVGETVGSAMTFGAASKASAPGQIDVKELNEILNIIHKSL